MSVLTATVLEHMPKGVRCSIEGCTEPSKSRGLCRNHYYRWSYYGDPEYSKPIVLTIYGRIQQCECGCGQIAGLQASGTSPRNGPKIKKGYPKRFILGHHNRLADYQQHTPPFDDCYEVTPSGCWRWLTASPTEDGYGRYRIDGHPIQAHRYSYERTYGPIPDGDIHIDHLCHDPKTCKGGRTCPHRACVNPNHLAITSHAANCRRGVMAKLNYDQAAEIRRRRAAGEKGVDLAREFEVCTSTISCIVQGKTWKDN